MKIESHILDVIEGKKEAPLTKGVLNVLSQFYRAGAFINHAAYDYVIAQTRLSLPVISVGNIVAGGTGKTPIVHYLAKALSQKKVAILSRGYRRKNTTKRLLVEKGITPEQCGDEPYLLAQKLPEAKVIVGSNRVFSGHLAEILGVELIILDDGMQHRRLHRDIEIGVVDAQDLLGHGHFLPRGFLRDSPKRLSKMDLILVTGEYDQSIETFLRNFTDAPITAMQLNVENQVEVASKKVGIFCGIARPIRFINTLKTLGCDIVSKLEKPDHRAPSIEELETLANLAHAQGGEALICTEKDAVKLPQDLKLCLPIIPLRISLEPTTGKEHLDALIQGVLHDRF